MIEWEVELTLTEPMLGTVPKNRDVYSRFIESQKEKRAGEKPKDTEVDTVDAVDEAKGWTGFHKDDDGLFVYDYFIKGALKEAGNILKESLKIKALRSKLDNYVFIFPRRVRILDENGKNLDEPDGVFERPLRAQTPQGPRVSLVKSDRINDGRKLKFTMKALDVNPIPKIEKVIESCLDYWALKGLGQFRNGSFGRVTYEKKLVSK
jgi:hypothetical protein